VVRHVTLALTLAAVGVGGSVLALAPGLILVGAGMGLGITPLTSLVMAAAPPRHVGATAGVLATMQNVGNAVGVAVVGVLFYGSVSHGFAGAFQISVIALAVALAGVAALTRLIPATVGS